jgi:carboxylesterase type B
MESGTYAYTSVCNNPSNNEYTAWNSLAAELNCTGSDDKKYACIKIAPATAIKDAQERNAIIAFGHACDNINVVSNPRTRLEAGNVANVPIILGTNTAEGSFYTIPYGLNSSAYFNTHFPGNAALEEAVLAAYPRGTEGRTDEQFQLQQIHTDWSFHCPTVWYSQTSAAQRPTYRYLFNATFGNTRVEGANWPVQYQGAYHSSEILIVFTSYNEATAEPGQRALSDAMRRAWANFAKEPTQAPLQEWTRVTTQAGDADVMGFGVDGKGQYGMIEDRDKCQFWADMGFRTLFP